MKRYFLIPLLAILLAVDVYAQKKVQPKITVDELRDHIEYLASDELEGRFPGTEGSYEASEYVREQFRKAGLKLLFDDGFQYFSAVVSVKAGPDNSLSFDDHKATYEEDFVPYPFSKSASARGGLVFVGYGFDIDTDSLEWSDYGNMDVQGKWVMILRGDPEMDKPESHFAYYGEDRDKVILARDKGAAGVLFVSGKSYDEQDHLVSMFFDKTQSNAGLPVFHVKRTLADQMLSPTGKTIEGLEEQINSNMTPDSFETPVVVEGNADLVQETVRARNVVGMLEGSDPGLKNTYIVLGAHYDHLGWGGQGSGSRLLDSMAIHNGADDNASGTAGIIELAGYLVSQQKYLGRSLIFVAFDGEEQGLLGSKYFVSNPPVDLKSVKAMFNFDMIGRLDPEKKSVMIGGTGTAVEMEDLLKSHSPADFTVSFSPDGYGPSDHASFYAENIPVFFFTTGAHEDYHTPEDDWQKINFQGEKEVLDYAAYFVEILASGKKELTFQEAGPKKESSRHGYRFKVTLGIMPDFTSSDNNGLGVGGVKKDGPADKGGMQKGDVIVAIDGKAVTDIYDYMNRLQKLHAGQVISVDVMRDGKKKVLIIQL